MIYYFIFFIWHATSRTRPFELELSFTSSTSLKTLILLFFLLHEVLYLTKLEQLLHLIFYLKLRF